MWTTVIIKSLFCAVDTSDRSPFSLKKSHKRYALFKNNHKHFQIKIKISLGESHEMSPQNQMT